MKRVAQGREAKQQASPSSVLTKAVLSAAQRLDLSSKRLGAVLGSSEASVSRLRSGSRQLRPGSKEGQLAILFLRLYRSLDAIVGGNEAQARAWFNAENTHLGGAPAELALGVEGLVHVVQYLDAMRGKL